MAVHIRKLMHKKPARMMFAPFTREDVEILHRSGYCHAMVLLSFDECERRYHGTTLPCPPQFEAWPEPPAVARLRNVLRCCEKSHSDAHSYAALSAAVRDVLRVYE